VTWHFGPGTWRDLPYRLFDVAANSGTARLKGFHMADKRARDAVNGRFIPLEEAKRRPRETIVETIKSESRKKKR
jgi:hypothetical protein